MSKVKSSDISHYELLYFIPNKFTEEEIKPMIEQVGKIITNKGGNITLTEEWGKKRLAYPIKNLGYAYYILVEFDSEGGKLKEIDRALRMMSEIFRHQIVVKKVKSAEEIKKAKEISKKIAVREAKEKEETLCQKEKPKKKEKVDMEGLDKKLDKILETDDLL